MTKKSFLFAPKGIHKLRAGFCGEAIVIWINVSEVSCKNLQESLVRFKEENPQSAFIAANESEQTAIGKPVEFKWSELGVVLEVDCLVPIGEKEYLGGYFSTNCDYSKLENGKFPDGCIGSRSRPAEITGNPSICFGTLTTEPSFRKIKE